MKAVQLLTENLQELGHEVFSYVSDQRNFVPQDEMDEERLALFNNSDNWRKRDELKKLFDKDLGGLTQSDICVLLLPSGKGAHIQAGIGYGFNKHMVLIGELKSVEVHYMVFDEWHKTIEDYLKSLKK